jgi:hypothetical protein
MGCAMFRVGTRSSMKQASNFVYVGNITLRGRSAVTKMQLTKNNSNFRGCRASWKGVRN